MCDGEKEAGDAVMLTIMEINTAKRFPCGTLSFFLLLRKRKWGHRKFGF